MSENDHQNIELPPNMTVRDLAQKLDTSPIDVIKALMANGVMANINQTVDFDTAAIVASELGFDAILETPEPVTEEKDVGEIPLWRQIISDENPEYLNTRPPVVTILGHVDHGKTTLLDAIRHTEVAEGEAGGITQHIGAYQIEHQNQVITFLDTPGHAAFTAMRARGAHGADIVVLVVAADDGVMPQTKEAIAHARAAQVPIIVALNKIDRQDANPDFVKRQLADSGLVPDEWDGSTIVVPVSAKERSGLDDLLEAILLVADSCDIQANPAGKVLGTVIEARLDKSKGVLASLLIQNGTLKSGDIIAAGTTCGRIRAMFDFKSRSIDKAGPSSPVLIMGLGNIPAAGDLFRTYPNEREARSVSAERELQRQLQLQQKAAPKATLEELFDNIKSGDLQELRLIIKADVQGSLEPIITSLNNLDNHNISINILHAETGNITESDIMLAAASKAIVIGFSVQADYTARRLAEVEGTSIRIYQIIYRLIEDVEKALLGMLEPEEREVEIGRAQVLAVFRVSKFGHAAGCRVISGEIRRNAHIRVIRDDQVLFDGEIGSLKHEKDDVREIRVGFECGIALKRFSDFKEKDELVCYIVERD